MIVKMKKAKVFVLKEYEEALKRSLQRYGVLMITNNQGQQRVVDTSYEDNIINRTNRVIKELDKYKEKPKLLSPTFQVVDYERFSDIREEQIELLEKVEKMLAKISRLKEHNEERLEANKVLLPFENLEVKIRDIKTLEYAHIYLGQVLESNQEAFNGYLELNNIDYKTYGSNASGLAYAIASKEDILTDLENAGFQKVNLPLINHLVKDEIEHNLEVINIGNLKS